VFWGRATDFLAVDAQAATLEAVSHEAVSATRRWEDDMVRPKCVRTLFLLGLATRRSPVAA
jgi:hypothetical protein